MALTRWVRLSVDFYDDDKIDQLTDGQVILYQKLILWSSKHKTDGRIPSATLRTIAGRYTRNLQGSMEKMEVLGLLRRTKNEPRTNQEQTWTISTYNKWQMNTDAAKHETAGQAGWPGAPSHVRTPPGIENRTDRRSYSQGSSSLAPEPVRMVDGVRHRFLAGSGWVKDHDSDATTEAGKE